MVAPLGLLGEFSDLARAGVELAAGQLGVAGLMPISTQAGQLLRDAGVFPTVDQGIAVFHESISKGRPGLRRILRRNDRKSGRIKFWTDGGKRSPTQRVFDRALKNGDVKRNGGRIVSFPKKVKAEARKLNSKHTGHKKK